MGRVCLIGHGWIRIRLRDRASSPVKIMPVCDDKGDRTTLTFSLLAGSFTIHLKNAIFPCRNVQGHEAPLRLRVKHNLPSAAPMRTHSPRVVIKQDTFAPVEAGSCHAENTPHAVTPLYRSSKHCLARLINASRICGGGGWVADRHPWSGLLK